MCLAIPGKLESKSTNTEDLFTTGKVSFDGIIKEVSLALVPEVEIGDYVLVHAGAAISVIDATEAKKTFDILKELDELNDLSPDN